MEKNESKTTLIIVFLTTIILILGGYFCYDKLFNDLETQPNENNTNKNNTNENINLKNIKFLDDYKNDKQYLVKINDDKYEVIRNLGENIHYIGIYNNKLYYSDTSIKYIDLNSEDLTEKTLLEIPQPNCTHACVGNYISKSAIIDDTLYFNLGSFSGGVDKYDGLLSININSTDFNDYKQLIADAELDKWYINEDNTKIYYAKFNYGFGVVPSEYTIKNNTNTQLIDTKYINDIKYENGKIIYYLYESDRYDANWNKIYSCNCTPHYELYIYDVNNKNIDLITKEINDNTSGSLFYIANMINNKIYYYTSDGMIHQYNSNDKSSTDYYLIPNNSGYRGFNFINENTMKIWYEDGINKYVVNNKEVDTLDEIKVTMLDNSIETFTIENIK